jgi:hypothetical protein
MPLGFRFESCARSYFLGETGYSLLKTTFIRVSILPEGEKFLIML